MEMAVVRRDVAPVLEGPGEDTPRLDEALFGMEVKLLESGPQWCRVESEWGFAGFTRAENLLLGQEAATEWDRLGKMVARAPYVDVLAAPDAKAPVVAGLPRGGLLHTAGPQDENGYLPVSLPGGGTGFAKGGNLMPLLSGRAGGEAQKVREALASTALSYLGVQYRQGGRSPQGIDDAGLVLMACRLNGVRLTGTFVTAPDGPLYLVAREALATGDVVVFKAHVGLCLGDGNFVHATARPGSDGVVVNSLDAQSPFYRQDLADSILRCVSLFAPRA